MKHQELLIDVHFYQARDYLIEQAVSKKEQKEPKDQSHCLNSMTSEKK
ncbi:MULTISPECIES: hypothetical protein [Bacillus]|uniref:Uncharacterized protein n=1 Tax=Bacillus altitudinis TaxID=293387 RepID=A0A1K1YSS7_BACAB|nr:hypothetical protein [Bacillus altitudinis]MDN0039288.1 hypothetical protein [Bacillus aerophilus]MCI9885105.1 hypothetical protein [Bacillus altitudinis]MCY7712353.1 hypothetical protein [Bacillus altitudinis]MDM5163422.1 hypothetical protein [Bacillus altitudinis]MDX2365528.1 hypothetical protein [Bacillus altitudinis]